MEPRSSRWNRNYNKVSEYYFKWEIDVMKKPECIFETAGMMETIEVPTLEFNIPNY